MSGEIVAVFIALGLFDNVARGSGISPFAVHLFLLITIMVFMAMFVNKGENG